MNGTGKISPVSEAAALLFSSDRAFWQGVSVQRFRLRPTECRPHPIAMYSVVLQTSEPVRIEWTEGKTCRQKQMNPGDVSLHSVGELPGFRLYQAVEMVEIGFTPQFAARVIHAGCGPSFAELRPAYGISDAQIQRIGLALQAEVEAGCPGGVLLGESLAVALAAHIFTQYRTGAKTEPLPSSGLSRSDMRRVLAYIQDNLERDMTLDALAGMVHLSPHHFALRFRQSLGISPHQFVLGQRIEKARYLLTNSRDTLAEIALAVGFASQSHFTLHFKRTVGLPPGQYRKAAGVAHLSGTK